MLERNRSLAGMVRLFWKMRSRRFDLAIDMCTFSFFLSRVFCAIPQRVKLQLPHFWWLVPHRNSWGKEHALFHYLSVIKPLGISPEDVHLRLTLSDADRSFAAKYLRERDVKDGDMLVAIHPGGEGFFGKKRWRAGGFARVADRLVSQYGAKVLILGGGDESGLAKEVAGRMKEDCLNGAGQTSLKQTAALIERCRLFIGNDSSPLHLSAAVATPAIGIYGPSNPDNFRPLGVEHVVVRKDLDCAPCFHFIGATPFWRRSFCTRCRALDAVSVGDVMGAVEKLLAGKGVKEVQRAKVTAQEALAFSAFDPG